MLTLQQVKAKIHLDTNKKKMHWRKVEKNALEKARKKYNPAETTITGHSQFKFIGSRIASQKHGDKVIAYNGASVGGKVNDNERHYRIDKDIISAPTLMDKNTKSYSTKPIKKFQNPLQRI